MKTKHKGILTFAPGRYSIITIGILAIAGNLSAREMRFNHGFNQTGNVLIADQFNKGAS